MMSYLRQALVFALEATTLPQQVRDAVEDWFDVAELAKDELIKLDYAEVRAHKINDLLKDTKFETADAPVCVSELEVDLLKMQLGLKKAEVHLRTKEAHPVCIDVIIQNVTVTWRKPSQIRDFDALYSLVDMLLDGVSRQLEVDIKIHSPVATDGSRQLLHISLQENGFCGGFATTLANVRAVISEGLPSHDGAEQTGEEVFTIAEVGIEKKQNSFSSAASPGAPWAEFQHYSAEAKDVSFSFGQPLLTFLTRCVVSKDFSHYHPCVIKATLPSLLLSNACFTSAEPVTIKAHGIRRATLGACQDDIDLFTLHCSPEAKLSVSFYPEISISIPSCDITIPLDLIASQAAAVIDNARASETVVHWAGVVAVAAAYRTARERADLAAFGNPLWDGVIEDESDSDEELLYAGTFNPKDQQVVFQSCVAGDDTALWTRLPETRAFQTCRDAVATRRSVRNPSHLFHSALGPSMFQTTAPTQPATESRRSICSAMSADEQILQTDTDAHCHNHADIQHDAVSMHTEPAAPRSPTCPSGCEPALARAASESESDVETGLQASVPPFPAFSFSIGNTTLIVRKDTARVPVGAGRNPEQDAARIGFAVKVTPIRVVSRVEDRSPAAGIAPTGQVVVSEFEVGISTFDGTGDEHRPLVLALHKISAKVDVLPHKGSALHVAELEVKVGGLSVDVRSFGGLLVAKNVGESALVVSRTVRTAASVTSSAMQARRADLFGKPATVESSPRIARSSSFTLTNRWTAISVATLDMTLPCIDDTPKGYTVSLTDFRFTPYLTTIASFAITQTGTHHLLNTSLGEHELANQPFMSILTTHEQPASGSAAEPGVDAQLSKKDYQVSISRVNFKDTADLSFFRTLARAAKCAAATTLPPQSRPAAATPASNQSPPLRIFLFRCSLTLLGTVLRRPLPGLFPQAGGSEPPPAPVLFKAELPQALVSRPESGVPTIATDAATVHICCAALRAWSHARNRAPESTAKTKPQSGAGAGVSTEPHVAWNGEAENPMSERVYVAEQHDGGHVGNSTVQEAKRVCVEIQSIAVSIWDDFTLPDGSCIHTELNSAVVRVCGGVQPKCEAEVFSVRVSYRCGGDTTSVLFLTNPEQNEGAIRLAAAGPRLVVDKRSPTRRAKRLKLVVQTPVQIAIFPPGLVNALSLLRAHQQKSRRDSDDEPSDPLLVKLILQKGSGASCVSLPIRLVSCKKYLPLANALWGTVRAFPEMDKMREHASSLEAFRSMVASILPKPSAAEHWPPATVSAAISRVSESVTSLFNGLAG